MKNAYGSKKKRGKNALMQKLITAQSMAPPDAGVPPAAMAPPVAPAMVPPGMKNGGSASSRADGIATKGKTKGRMY